MRYPGDNYSRTEHADCLELHCFDGTYRSVHFVNPLHADHAMLAGRAEIDRGAIDCGFLPSGPYLVSRASVSPCPQGQMAGDGDVGSRRAPLDFARRRFSASLLAGRTQYIATDRNATARTRKPDRAVGYNATAFRINRGNSSG